LAPDIDAYITDEARDFFGGVTEGLQAAGVAWTRDSRLVRGMDYYRHTAFEFVTDRLGAQGTVLGGGRYDGLIESLGGAATPAVGWAAGIERLAMLLDAAPLHHVEVAVIPMGEAAALAATGIVASLRRAGFASELGFKGSMKKRMQKANDMGARYAVIVGEDELAKGVASLKNLQTGAQQEVAIDAVAAAIRA
jgi:histidyl-tRNA synthetase